VSAFAPATDAHIGEVFSLAINRQNNTLYVPDNGLSRLRQVNLGTGIITNFAGVGWYSPYPVGEYGDDGPALDAWLPSPEGVAIAPDNSVLLTEWGRSRLHRIAGGIITPIAGKDDPSGLPMIVSSGDGGPANQASFGQPDAVAVDRSGNIFILDQGGMGQSATIRRIDATTNIIDTVVGGGTTAPAARPPASSSTASAISPSTTMATSSSPHNSKCSRSNWQAASSHRMPAQV
jgi:DNA-binding beta-propeller fold protein YncE